ncbi:MAG TPA: hypothetical protein VL282_15235 [Tepidisphaeraceae bacterium]|jgi:hypothetical protein|nr:hypothetical protein [Tepidisphaeraceae bacterium]
MDEITGEIGVAPLLARYHAMGGVLDYVFLKAEEESSSELIHRKAALRGMAMIAGRESRAQFDDEIRWDGTKLVGEPIDVLAHPMPNGYRPAFFSPPYALRGSAIEQADLFAAINRYVFGSEPQRAEMFSWSTDWSNYFDAGHEWWGAFYRTIRPRDAGYIAVVGASSSD